MLSFSGEWCIVIFRAGAGDPVAVGELFAPGSRSAHPGCARYHLDCLHYCYSLVLHCSRARNLALISERRSRLRWARRPHCPRTFYEALSHLARRWAAGTLAVARCLHRPRGSKPHRPAEFLLRAIRSPAPGRRRRRPRCCRRVAISRCWPPDPAGVGARDASLAAALRRRAGDDPGHAGSSSPSGWRAIMTPQRTKPPHRTWPSWLRNRPDHPRRMRPARPLAPRPI